jgi:TolB protein
MNRLLATMAIISCCMGASASSWNHRSSAQLWLPGVVSTERSEVRITFSPDGTRMLWGGIDWPDGAGGWDIYESYKTSAGWSRPISVSFNSAANDFDPSFAPDGSGVYFFSNRAGGFGKDDLYFAPFDRNAGRYSAAVNLGAEVNSPGDEWAPVVSADGKQLLFATDGRGGKGKHDLFIASRNAHRWVDPENLDVLNSAEEDFDAAFLIDDRSIVYSRGELDGKVELYVSLYREGQLQPGVRLDAAINAIAADAWTFGPSISPHDPGALYFTSRRAEHRGRADIYRIEYTLAK